MRQRTGIWYAVDQQLSGIDAFVGWLFIANHQLCLKTSSTRPVSVTLDDLLLEQIDPGQIATEP